MVIRTPVLKRGRWSPELGKREDEKIRERWFDAKH